MPDQGKLPDVEEAKVEVVAPTFEEAPTGVKTTKTFDSSSWQPRTELGKKVKSGEIKSLVEIFDKNQKIIETEIIDMMLPNLESELLTIGQAKGKFGGGKGSIWKQTQKKTSEGNQPSFATFVVVGNRDGYVGFGYGKSRETMPAREKAMKKAKLNIFGIRRGCGSWECGCKEPHSIPFKVKGRCGSTRITLMPAPKGTGLKVENECSRALALAGIKDVYSKTYGHTNTKTNLLAALLIALSQLSKMKVSDAFLKSVGGVEGTIDHGK